MEQSIPSRRQFLAASGNLASASWVAMNWPQIAAAAEMAEMAGQTGHGGHGGHDMKPPLHSIGTLNVADAADVDAIANLIVPGGKTPGAREAKVVVFIDLALGSFFAAQLPAFRQGLAEFQKAHAERNAGSPTFSTAPQAQQIAWLKEVDKTPFFIAVRRLTILGLLAMPRYGGNFEKKGWQVIGFVDRHVWQPPFGDYEQDYGGFVPYPGTKPYTA